MNTQNRGGFFRAKTELPCDLATPLLDTSRGSDVSTLERHLKSQVYQELFIRVNGESAEVSMVGIKTQTECRTHIKQNAMQGRLKQPSAA